jgi:hypothetical protein
LRDHPSWLLPPCSSWRTPIIGLSATALLLNLLDPEGISNVPQDWKSLDLKALAGHLAET